LVWQQIETFLDRIDGARDQDDPHRRKLEALLKVANVVERRRAFDFGEVALSDAVVDALPAQYFDPTETEQSKTKATSALEGGGWSRDLRRWRLPGIDEVELAVGLLATTEVDLDDDEPEPPVALEKVRLPVRRQLFQRRADTGLEMVQLPSYPGSLDGSAMPYDIEADPDDDGDRSSLFSRRRRYKATMGQFEEDEEPVTSWSDLCACRRSGATADTVLYSGLGGLPAPASGGLAGEAQALLTLLAIGYPASIVAARLEQLSAAARTAATSGQVDAQVFRDAADVVDKEGAAQENLGAELRTAADYFGGNPIALENLAAAADALRADTGSTAARHALKTAATAAAPPAVLPAVLLQSVETGLLSTDLNDAAGARVAYPDGTLRILRTLEAAFATSWGAWLRWLVLRDRMVLEPVMRRFRLPFVDSVRALAHGGPTGLACEGLEIGQDVSVGADTVITAQPASLKSTLDDLAPGQVGVVGGGRPTALVLLGLGRMGDKLTLGVSPVRVSTASDGPGAPGVLAADEAILSTAPNLSTGELRRGEADDGPAADGLVHETVALWSRLRLVFGSKVIDNEAGGAGLVPEPASTPLESSTLFGKVPSFATVVVITGLSDAYWDRTEVEPQPRVARPGEILLVRGWAEPEWDQPGATVQAAVEVDRVFRTTGSMLARMKLDAAARLSTAPLDLDEDGVPCLPCGPEEDVMIMILQRSWMRRTLVSSITLRRDFVGFDSPCLATDRLLPVDVLARVLKKPASEVEGVPGVDRQQEFRAARDILTSWLRFGSDE
jgi:hypothetical protein